MVKFRNGYVSNSSSSSFICKMCGTKGEQFDWKAPICTSCRAGMETVIEQWVRDNNIVCNGHNSIEQNIEKLIDDIVERFGEIEMVRVHYED